MAETGAAAWRLRSASLNGPDALKMSARSSVIPAARPRSGTSPGKSGRPRLWNSPSLRAGPVWHAVAMGGADEQLQPARGGRRERSLFGRIAGAQPFDIGVEGRHAADQLALVGFDRLAEIAEHAVDCGAVGGRHRLPGLGHRGSRIGIGARMRRKAGGIGERRQVPEDPLIGRAERRIVGDAMGDMQPVAADFARVFKRLQGLRPQRIGTAVPEKPVIERGVEQARRVPRAEGAPSPAPARR